MAEIGGLKSFYWPIVSAIRTLSRVPGEYPNGIIPNNKIGPWIISDLDLPEDSRDPKTDNGQKFATRMALARTDLKKAGLINNPSRGMWEETDAGRALGSQQEVEEVTARAKREAQRAAKPAGPPKKRGRKPAAEVRVEIPQRGISAQLNLSDWQRELLRVINRLSDEKFEAFCEKFFTACGFTSLNITRHENGRVYGMGTMRIGPVATFATRFVVSRGTRFVEASDVRFLHGTMHGRSDKGVYITTSAFSPDAVKEANREWAPPVDLIDGEALCAEMMKHKLGVHTVKSGELDPAYFARF